MKNFSSKNKLFIKILLYIILPAFILTPSNSSGYSNLRSIRNAEDLTTAQAIGILIEEGEKLWEMMRGEERNELSCFGDERDYGAFFLALCMEIDNLTISWPFLHLISGSGAERVDLSQVHQKEFYVLKTEVLQVGLQLKAPKAFQYFELSKQEAEAVKAYICSRPDRHMARIIRPSGGTPSSRSPDYWPHYYAGKSEEGKKGLELNRRTHPFVAERVVKAIDIMSKANERKMSFNILQDGFGDAKLLMLVRERLKEKFPNLRFRFFGVDKRAGEIMAATGTEIEEEDVSLENGVAEDPNIFPEAQSGNFFDIILDYGLTVRSVITTEKQADAIFQKWSSQLRHGGLVFSIPAGESWMYKMALPTNLRFVSHSIPELHFMRRPPPVFITLQKNGGRRILAMDLFDDIVYRPKITETILTNLPAARVEVTENITMGNP